MESPTNRSFLQALPKCEHHIHLEGALTPSVLFKLAAKNKVSLPADDAAFASPQALVERYTKFTSLDDFLQYYYIGMSVLVDASDFEALAWDYFQHAKADGVVHAEVFFDPQAHLSRGVAYDVVLAGFNAARRRAEEELGISNELICCFLRHLPPAECEATLALSEVQASLSDKSVIGDAVEVSVSAVRDWLTTGTGVGLDSSETPFPPHMFQALYQFASSLNIKRTAHAGEEAPPEYIRSALDDLAVDRIDHGIRLADDPALLARVVAEGKMLTVCPVSNVLLRCTPNIASLPIRKFLEAGVSFSINSDDPAYFGGNYILDNYVAVQDAFNFTVAEWARICENSIRGSWCSEQRKEQLLHLLKQVIAKYEAQ